MGVSGVGGSYGTPSGTTSAAPSSGSLTMDDFMLLMAKQLQNQDMTNPMDNSEMMNQLTQMATVQAMNTFTDLATSQYALNLMGQHVKVSYVDKTTGKLLYKEGVVDGIDMASNHIFLKDDDGEYGLANVVTVGKVPEKDDDDDKTEEPKPDDGTEGPDGPSDTDQPSDDDTKPGTDPDKDESDKQSKRSSDTVSGYASYRAPFYVPLNMDSLPRDKAEFFRNYSVVDTYKQMAMSSRVQGIPADKQEALSKSVVRTGPGASI